MPNSAVIHTRIDPETKAATEEVLAAIGMTPSQAIKLFYRQIASRKAFPLELRVPNSLTQETFKKSDQGLEVERFETSEELFESWEK